MERGKRNIEPEVEKRRVDAQPPQTPLANVTLATISSLLFKLIPFLFPTDPVFNPFAIAAEDGGLAPDPGVGVPAFALKIALRFDLGSIEGGRAIDAGLGTFWSWCASADVERESVLVVLGKERRPPEPLTLVPRDGGREDVEDESD